MSRIDDRCVRVSPPPCADTDPAGGAEGNVANAMTAATTVGSRLASAVQKHAGQLHDQAMTQLSRNQDALQQARRKLARGVRNRRAARSTQQLIHRFKGRAAAAEKAATQASRLGRLASWTGRGCTLAGAAITAVDRYGKSAAQTEVGKCADAALGAGVSALFGAAVPTLAVADALTDEQVSKHLGGSASALVVAAEGLIIGDERGMVAFEEQAKRGDHGSAIQAAVESGDYWAEHGVAGTLSDFAHEVGSLFD